MTAETLELGARCHAQSGRRVAGGNTAPDRNWRNRGSVAGFFPTMNPTEPKAVLTIAMMAAFADGENSEVERNALRNMAGSFRADAQLNLWEIYQDVLARQRPLGEIAAELTTPEARALAYEMAVGVCEADDTVNEKERAFLDELRATLNPGAAASASLREAPPPVTQAAGAAPPVLEPVDAGAIDQMILHYSILNGALELLPHGLATMAIVPLQMRMVYRVGKRYGYTLDRGHIRDFLATAGVGLAAQAVENVARQLLGGLAGRMFGGLGRAVVGAGTGMGFAFAGTYAIGQLANRYYAGGRKMEGAVLRDTYARLLAEGRGLFGQHAGAVRARAGTLNPTDVINLVRQPQ
jgi:uncharacterized protein (DUF697 family)/tellurite resistance protein